MTTEQQRKKWVEYYHKYKHQKPYVENRKKRQKVYLERHTFVWLIKKLKKKAREEKRVCNIQPMDLYRIAKQQKLMCAISGRKLTKDNISIDHIQHKVNGGNDLPENIRLVTKEVNYARHTLNDEEFLSLCRDVVKFSA